MSLVSLVMRRLIRINIGQYWFLFSCVFVGTDYYTCHLWIQYSSTGMYSTYIHSTSLQRNPVCTIDTKCVTCNSGTMIRR